MGRKAQKNDSLPGSLDMLILRTLSLRDLHGYGIVQFIQQSSENELLVEEGSLYPALQRLELKRRSDWSSPTEILPHTNELVYSSGPRLALAGGWDSHRPVRHQRGLGGRALNTASRFSGVQY